MDTGELIRGQTRQKLRAGGSTFPSSLFLFLCWSVAQRIRECVEGQQGGSESWLRLAQQRRRNAWDSCGVLVIEEWVGARGLSLLALLVEPLSC